MASDSEQRRRGHRYIMAAWGSPLVAAVISLVLLLWSVNHQGTRGARPVGVLALYVALLVTSLLAGLASVFSLYGIRSRRQAAVIVPGALLGIGLSVCNAVICLLAYALEGVNLGG